MLYAFVTTLYGVSKVGIDFIPGNQHQRIKRRDTYPQAMSVVVVLMATMMFSFAMQIMQFAPQYLTFGFQKDSDGKLCSLEEGKMSHLAVKQAYHTSETGFGCQMTVLAQLYSKIALRFPLFNLLTFLLGWAFLISFSFFLFFHAVYKKSHQSTTLKMMQGYSSINSRFQDDDQDEDLASLISKTYREDEVKVYNRKAMKNDLVVSQWANNSCFDN